MKVALVHDFLVEYGGAERVLETLHEIFPGAPIFTAYLDLEGLGVHKERIKSWDIKTSWIQYFPRRLLSPLRIFAPQAFASFDLSKYDVVISSCNTYFSKAISTRPNQLHLSYIHTPPRYLYGYATSFNYKKHWWTHVLGELANHILRIYDFETSQKPDVLIANSKEVQKRIKKFYRRDSVIIYPPVEVEKIMNYELRVKGRKDYFLALSRLDRGKGTEVIVDAFTKLNLPLKIAGTGKELGNLKKIAGKNIQFLGQVSDEERIALLAHAKALIVASEDEDFGITAVEAQAAGTPVIAIKQGGYLESVVEGKTGVFFAPSGNPPDYKRYIDSETVNNLMQSVQSFEPKVFKKEDCQKNAEKFSKERFKKEILDLVNQRKNTIL